jgi:signal transduction histidine kinase
MADREQMKQLFGNLVLNAFQAMPNGGSLTITARTQKTGSGDEGTEDTSRTLIKTGQWVEVKMEDTGPGIPEADLPRIFDPFFTTRTKGTGLGLAICRQIVEAHAGTIRVSRTGPEGTAIDVTLPWEAPANG